MTSLDRRDAWSAIPQLEEKIKELEEEIKELKAIIQELQEEQ